jgi:hypothetical protein
MNDGSIPDLIKRALGDAQELVRSEVALAKAELSHEARRIAAGVVLLAAAAAAGLLGAVLLLTAAAWALAEILAWPVWAGFALTGAVVTIVAAIAGYVGKSRLAIDRPLPRTQETMKENMEWMRARTS